MDVEAFISFLNVDFSSTIFIYELKLAVVGTDALNSDMYVTPPALSSISVVFKYSNIVTKSTAISLAYISLIALYIAL